MRNTFIILTVAGLMAGAVLAQEKSASVEDILKELTTYSATTPATKTSPTPVAKEVLVAEVESAPSIMDEAALGEVAVAMPAGDVPVETIAEENQDGMPVSEFVQSQQGFPDVVKSAPENIAARLYRRTRLERDHRAVEVEGMKEVKEAWSTELVLRSYVLAAGARERMKLKNVTSSVDVGTLFPLVDFPKDSSAIYQPDTETIFVRNTQQNLAVLETMLGTMRVLKNSDGGDQVEIEAKFVEVSEGTLEELGFQWNLNGTMPVGGGSDTVVDDGATGLFANALRGSPTGSSPTLPFNTLANQGDGSTGASGDWSTFRINETFNTTPSSMTLRNNGSTPLDVIISALDQSSGADVLSAPRIVTKSGEEATIRVGERHYFPEVYEADTDQATMLTIAYQDFTEKLLGIELVVTPEVDGDQITLALNPRIIELTGWRNYQLAPANSIYNHRQNLINTKYTHGPVVARLPIFKKREIQTEVRISDGSTIGMGGLISEKIESFEDKVPVLGSLPLIGRLFRNEGERAVKRNLLMFVTAKIVEPTGRINTSRSFE
jgi:type II secretory pathway component GspD/PulD (secretin)